MVGVTRRTSSGRRDKSGRAVTGPAVAFCRSYGRLSSALPTPPLPALRLCSMCKRWRSSLQRGRSSTCGQRDSGPPLTYDPHLPQWLGTSNVDTNPKRCVTPGHPHSAFYGKPAPPPTHRWGSSNPNGTRKQSHGRWQRPARLTSDLPTPAMTRGSLTERDVAERGQRPQTHPPNGEHRRRTRNARHAPDADQCSALAMKPPTQWTTASPGPIQGGEGAEPDGTVPATRTRVGDEGRLKAGAAGAQWRVLT